ECFTVSAGVGRADVDVKKKASPPSVPVGGNVTYTLTVENHGPDTATGATVVDALPAGVQYVSASTTQGTCSQSGGTVTCRLGTMANRAKVTVTIVATATVAGTVANSATVSANENDPNTNNNSDSDSTRVDAPDLKLKKSASPNTVALNGLLTYT